MGIRTISDLRNKIEYFEHPLACGQGMLQHVIDGMNLVDRHIEQRKIGDEHHQLTYGQAMLQHFSSTEPEHQCSAKTSDQHHPGRVIRPEEHRLQGILPAPIALPIESLLFIGLTVKTHRFPDARQHVL